MTEAVVTVRQARHALFHQLIAASPALVIVVAGSKAVLGDGPPLEVKAGQACLMPDNAPLTVENRPDPAGAGYVARALPVPRAVVERAYGRLTGLGRTTQPRAQICVLTDEARALLDSFAAGGPAESWPPEVRQLRLEELMLWAARGGAVLHETGPMSLNARLRAMLVQDPAAEWQAGQAARGLNMSEPTLRRKLAAEGAGFAEILRDIRLTHGLALLQTTDLPIARVAAEAGYTSASQFAARFRARFGVLPRDIRQDEPGNDRSAA